MLKKQSFGIVHLIEYIISDEKLKTNIVKNFMVTLYWMLLDSKETSAFFLITEIAKS